MSPKAAEIIIRIAKPADAPALAGVYEQIEEISVAVDLIKKQIQTASQIETPFLAFAEGKITGLIALRLDPTLNKQSQSALVTELYVQPDLRGGSIELELLQAAEIAAREAGVRHLSLMTGLRNETAQEQYRSLGFKDYALAMRKFLT